MTIKGLDQAVQMFGPAQAAVAKAVADSVAEGVIPKGEAENLVIVCGVFIHWDAKDDDKIYQYNYEATKLAIASAMKGEPKIDEITRQEGHGQAPVLAVSTCHSPSRRQEVAAPEPVVFTPKAFHPIAQGCRELAASLRSDDANKRLPRRGCIDSSR